MGIKESLLKGLARSREAINEVFYFGGEVDESFWEELEDTLVLADMGGELSMNVVDTLRQKAASQNLRSAKQLKSNLCNLLSDIFVAPDTDPFSKDKAVVLFVGINGAGKTTTVGKIASSAKESGKHVLIGAADTFRAAAIEQLEVWAQRSGVEMVTRKRGSDPASVCFDVLEKAEEQSSDLVLIDTAGRLHTSQELMRELAKVVSVTRKRSPYPVYIVLVIDATTGQNGLTQAHEFNNALELDGVILTKLDGTAKGGISLAIAHELKLPIYRIGVGEKLSDLQEFNAQDFCHALIGE